MITETELRLEIGDVAYGNLTEEERNFIVQQSDSVALGGLKAFELLMKKYKPSYKMGKMYCDNSSLYERYRDMFYLYSRQFQAGTSTSKLESDLISWT